MKFCNRFSPYIQQYSLFNSCLNCCVYVCTAVFTPCIMYLTLNISVHCIMCNMYVLWYSGWLSSGDDPLGYVDRIDHRIEDFTGLTMSTAEQLQVYTHTLKNHLFAYLTHVQQGYDSCHYVCKCVCVCLSGSQLTSGASVCPENTIKYSAGNRDRNIFSKPHVLRRLSTPSLR